MHTDVEAAPGLPDEAAADVEAIGAATPSEDTVAASSVTAGTDAAVAAPLDTESLIPESKHLDACDPAPAISGALTVVPVYDLDWPAIRDSADSAEIRARMRSTVEGMESLLDRAGGPALMFDECRADSDDRAICLAPGSASGSLWIIGDLHGDILGLEAGLAQIRAHAMTAGESGHPRIIFLGDFFDDAGRGLEVLLRVFELILEAPERVCVIAGNHDEALSYDGVRFSSSVSPSDFSDFLNANLAHEWIERTGKLAVRLIASAPRALFFPDGLLVSHGGFPLSDLHQQLIDTGNWNDPACLTDFVWARAHPKARKKMPNRFSRGSQFGYEDFADFCAVSTQLGRPVTHMVRGHDHPEERYATYPAYAAHPILTTVALSRRLDREQFGPKHRAPTLAKVVEGALPEVYQLHIPIDMILDFFPDDSVHIDDAASAAGDTP